MEVWGESKRLAISHRRYNEFYKFRGDLLEDLGKEGLHDEVRRPQALFTARRFAGLTSGRGCCGGGGWQVGKMERLPFPQKTDVKVMLLGKNSEAVRTKRIVELVRPHCLLHTRQ